MQMSYVKRSMITAVCIALCVVLPMAFHSIPNSGSILCPMHIPVLLCGLICGWPFGLLCGLVGPLFSSLITGMPPMAYLPPMMIELAVYGLVCGIVMQLVHTKKLYADLYVSLLTSMVAGRVVAGLAKAFLFSGGEYTMAAWVSSYLITCWPAIVIQLVLIPAVVVALMKARLVPERYPAKPQEQG